MKAEHLSPRNLFLVKECVFPFLFEFFKILNWLVLRSPHDHKVYLETTVNEMSHLLMLKSSEM